MFFKRVSRAALVDQKGIFFKETFMRNGDKLSGKNQGYVFHGRTVGGENLVNAATKLCGIVARVFTEQKRNLGEEETLQYERSFPRGSVIGHVLGTNLKMTIQKEYLP